MTEAMPPRSQGRPKTSGPGRTLIVFYFIMTIAALARSIFQILTQFNQAPVAILLSLASGVVYLVATIALLRSGYRAYYTAFTAMTFELIGVLVVGTLTLIRPSLFPLPTVWSFYGAEYVLIPLALPILGLFFLRSQRQVFARTVA